MTARAKMVETTITRCGNELHVAPDFGELVGGLLSGALDGASLLDRNKPMEPRPTSRTSSKPSSSKSVAKKPRVSPWV